MSGLKFLLRNEILYVFFHRPSAGNSFGIAEAIELRSALKKHRSARGLLWTSEHPRLFCAGGDLSHHAELPSKVAGLGEAKKIALALKDLAAAPFPKAAVVSGDCYGGGMELLSCFDFRVASQHVLFGFWQRRIALSFGWGGYGRWSRHVAAGKLKELSFPARVFGAAEALRTGFIHAIGSPADAEAWLAQASRWDTASGVSLAALDEASEAKIFQKLWWNEHHRAALRKFIGRR